MSASGGLESSVTLDELFGVLGTRRIALAPELAGYLVLEIAEHADPAGGDVDPKAVFVSEEGTVALVKPRRDTYSGNAEGSIRAVLARLLEASGSQTPALAAASKRKSGAGLPALAEELETALIPVNRSAGRRALARLARDVRRVTLGVGRNALPSTADALPSSRRISQPSYPAQPVAPVTASSQSPPASFSSEEDPTTARARIPDELLRNATPAEASEMPTTQFEPMARTPSPSQADVDSLIADFGVSGGGDERHARELKAMAGLEPTPAPPSAPPDEAPLRTAPPAPSPMLPSTPSRKHDSRQLPTGPSELKLASGHGPGTLAASPAKRRPLFTIFTAAVVIAAGAYCVGKLRPAERTSAVATKATPAPAPPQPRPPACNATLVVTDVPARAEVLLHEGQAPVDIEQMPVGTRLEFVGTAEGYAPKRVVVPAGATWDRGADGAPRFEAAVQLDRSSARAGATSPWPSGEPGTKVGGQGPPGTVRVVATPPGAEVWMLVGAAPEARVDQLPCNQDLDVLIAGPTTFRKKLHVPASDFDLPAVSPAAKGGGPVQVTTRTAQVSAR